MSIVETPVRLPVHMQIVQNFARMPRAEQKVASFLLHEGHNHHDLSLVELARMAGVSNAVVIRMCKLLGFSGFRDFRLEWARVGARSEPKETVAPSVYDDVFSALRQSVDLLSVAELDRAATAILQSRQLFVYGSGGSSFIANLAAATFNTVGRMSIPFTESVWQIYNRIYSDAETAILVITHRGSNSTIQKVLEADRGRGAKIIVMTSNPGSPLAHLADILLVTGSPVDNGDQMELSAARVVQIATVHALAKATIEMAHKTGLPLNKVEGALYDQRHDTLPR